MNFGRELREVSEDVDLAAFRVDLLEGVEVRAPADSDTEERDFAFVCEFATRLANAEEFQDFIPCRGVGIGYRSRRIRVDGYELDEVDDSIRLLIADFSGKEAVETITRARAETLFTQLRGFVEEAATGRIWNSSLGQSTQTRELAGTIEDRHLLRGDGTRAVSRYRFYLITDSVLSDRVKDLPEDELDGVPIERHIWDVNRLFSASTSVLGAEELEIDFTKFLPEGVPCLQASKTDDYDGYLCVIPGDVLAELYDRYGSRLLEGNVRSFLSTGGKVNKGIQATIRSEPDRFFVYNNGISATATAVRLVETNAGPRLLSALYLQIVNGGQTTASLHVAKRKDDARLDAIAVPMKLSVVRAEDTEMLDEMIQRIARYSNSQNKVSDADFFSNHPFHRAIERRSRSIQAPRTAGATFNTYWFYERARGQYINAQSKMSLKEKKDFSRHNPRSQLISKTDLAKFENSWQQMPQIVSRGAQKNFVKFAECIGKSYGVDGAQFDNELYYKEMVAKAIIFKFVEKMVSDAKKSWYGGDFRAQIVTYTIAKLAWVIEHNATGLALSLNAIWLTQCVSRQLAQQLEAIARVVSTTITTPPTQHMNVGEWCKTDACWGKVVDVAVPLSSGLRAELVTKAELQLAKKDATEQATVDIVINAVVAVVQLQQAGCWLRLIEWASRYSPLYGKDADLVRLASRRGWVPSDRQAATILNVLRRMEDGGFKRS